MDPRSAIFGVCPGGALPTQCLRDGASAALECLSRLLRQIRKRIQLVADEGPCGAVVAVNDREHLIGARAFWERSLPLPCDVHHRLRQEVGRRQYSECGQGPWRPIEVHFDLHAGQWMLERRAQAAGPNDLEDCVRLIRGVREPFGDGMTQLLRERARRGDSQADAMPLRFGCECVDSFLRSVDRVSVQARRSMVIARGLDPFRLGSMTPSNSMGSSSSGKPSSSYWMTFPMASIAFHGSTSARLKTASAAAAPAFKASAGAPRDTTLSSMALLQKGRVAWHRRFVDGEAPEKWQLQGFSLNSILYICPVSRLGRVIGHRVAAVPRTRLRASRQLHVAPVSGLRWPKPHGTIAPLMDLFDSSPTVLRHPVWYSDTASEAMTLPLSADNYSVAHAVGADGRWTVTSSTGEIVYRGIGPVTVT